MSIMFTEQAELRRAITKYNPSLWAMVSYMNLLDGMRYIAKHLRLDLELKDMADAQSRIQDVIAAIEQTFIMEDLTLVDLERQAEILRGNEALFLRRSRDWAAELDKVNGDLALTRKDLQFTEHQIHKIKTKQPTEGTN